MEMLSDYRVNKIFDTNVSHRAIARKELSIVVFIKC